MFGVAGKRFGNVTGRGGWIRFDSFVRERIRGFDSFVSSASAIVPVPYRTVNSYCVDSIRTMDPILRDRGIWRKTESHHITSHHWK
mmetsp:Transcript_23290/g.48919  ORF Transcript_23290/g.48919 Transcript_23290/m.48919 type:complete len:86 (-) Transcript_23290:7-264(-)